jgi:hypothetical protein
MSPTPRSPTDDAARGESVRPARRPLAVRGVQELPAARVVLHLPDLEALTSVALGPPQPTSRRRVDPPHVVQPAAESETASRAAGAPASSGPSLVNLLKVPLDKLTTENLVQGSKKLGQLALWIQQPKMMLAAVAAVALQLAAVLAMLTGSGDATPDGSGADSHNHAHSPRGPQGAPIVDHRRPIQTPLNSAPSQYSPMPPNFGPGRAPVAVAQPSPPQPLPGVNTDELPAWPGGDGPALVGSPNRATVEPTTNFAAPTSAPNNVPHGGSTRATPVSGKPKLKGTILKVNEAAR